MQCRLWDGPRPPAGPPYPGSRLDQEILALPVAGMDGALLPLEERLLLTDTDAFLVVHDGRLVTAWYRTPEVEFRPQTLMSVTKSVVGVLAGMGMTEGLLTPSRPVTDYVPELADSVYRSLTVRDLLDMRTGDALAQPVTDSHARNDEESLALLRAIEGTGPDLRTLVVTATEPVRSGGPFSYRSFTTEALAWAVERARGVPIVDQLADLCARLGLEGPVDVSVDAAGIPHSSGGLAMRAVDVARFAHIMLRGGSVEDRRIVPALFVKDTRLGGPDSASAFAECLAQVTAGLRPDPALAWGHYRNQFWVPSAHGRVVLCLGIHGQLVRIDADTDTVVVKLSSWPVPRRPPAFTDGLECAAAAAAHAATHHPDPVSPRL